MYPVVVIGKLLIPTYGIMTVIGFTLAILVYMHTASFFYMPRADVAYASIYAIVGLGIGAKLLYALTTLPTVIRHSDVFFAHPIEVLGFVFGGWVFYGGLLGAIAGVIIYCKKFQLNYIEFLDAAAPAVPLFHIFGRIGCFFAGCCYGKEYDGPFSVTYPRNHFTEKMAEVERVPVPIMEAMGNLILFVIVYTAIKKGQKNGRPMGIYLLGYSVMRFLLEFLRGDSYRGVLLNLSTSQWISLGLLPVGIWLLVKKHNSRTLQ